MGAESESTTIETEKTGTGLWVFRVALTASADLSRPRRFRAGHVADNRRWDPSDGGVFPQAGNR